MGKPVDEKTGKVKKRAEIYVCPACKYEVNCDEFDATLKVEIQYTCPVDGGNLDVVLDYDYLKKKFEPDDFTCRDVPSLWRYLPLLPVDDPKAEHTPLGMAGGTPVFEMPRLAEKLSI